MNQRFMDHLVYFRSRKKSSNKTFTEKQIIRDIERQEFLIEKKWEQGLSGQETTKSFFYFKK